MAPRPDPRPRMPQASAGLVLPTAPPTPGVVYPPRPSFHTIKPKRTGALDQPPRAAALRGPVRRLAPRPWLAIAIPTGETVRQLLEGQRHVIDICTCADCLAALDRELLGRVRREQGRARLILIETSEEPRTRAGVGVLRPQVLLARGVSRSAATAWISRVMVLPKAASALCSAAGWRRLRAGHLLVMPPDTLSSAAASLVARLPAPVQD